MSRNINGAEPFNIDIPQAKLDDLRRRLQHINWPLDPGNEDWAYGTSKAYLQEFVDYWLEQYDWREREAKMNAYDHYKAKIDGVPIHFIYQQGKGSNPKPIILTHGWPWTFWDFQQIIDPLTDPVAHGGEAEDAFDVIVPSLPGYAFSTPLNKTGVNWGVTADLWDKLMRDVLGYEKYGAHGGDWGALVSGQLGHKYSHHMTGLHLSNAFPLPGLDALRPWSMATLSSQVPQPEAAEEQKALQEKSLAWERKFSAHLAVHVLGPQTLAYGMHDSPLGLAAWLLERRRSWGDCRQGLENRFSRDHLLDTIMLYWLTDSFSSSVRYYRENANYQWQPTHNDYPVVNVPTALSLFEYDLAPAPLDWTALFYNLKSQQVYTSGGHFGAAEEPDIVLQDIRKHFRGLD